MPPPQELQTCGLNPSELRCILLVVLDEQFTLKADQAHRLMEALGYRSPIGARTLFNKAMRRLRANASMLTTTTTKKNDPQHKDDDKHDDDSDDSDDSDEDDDSDDSDEDDNDNE